MTSPSDARLGAQRPRWAKLPPDVASGSGDEAIDLAASIGLILDDWQQWWLRQALSERADGDWAAFENVLICARQNGKNGALAALELFYLFTLGDPLVIHSAHELPTAINHFKFLLALIEGSPDLSRKCKRPTFTNGKEAINLRSGAMLQIRARGKNSGRGLTASRIVFDEAFKIDPESMGALMPTMRAVPNPQITYASSAPKADSVVLHSLIQRGRRNDSADRLFYAEWGNDIGTAPDDVDAWYAANPAIGFRVTEEALRMEYQSLVSGGNEELIAEFMREAVGVGEEPVADAKPVKIPAEAWAATAGVEVPPQPGRMTIAYAVSRDGEWSSIAIGDGSITDPYAAVIEHRKGVGWLPGRLVELVERWDPIAVGWNNAGPAAAQSGAVLEAFRAAGIDVGRLEPVNTQDYKSACGGLFTDIIEGRLRRPDGQGPLDVAVAEASERPLGDAWAWDIRNATVPLSPLEAVTVARFLLPTEVPAAKPVFAF